MEGKEGTRDRETGRKRRVSEGATGRDGGREREIEGVRGESIRKYSSLRRKTNLGVP